MATSFGQARRFLLIALVLTSTVVVCEDGGYGSDQTEPDFSDPALSEDPVASGPHSDVEPAWIIPDGPDGKVHIGGTTDLLVALSNSGPKGFNVSHIEGKLLTLAGKKAKDLPTYSYGQTLSAREQRSFRYPLPLDAETPLGEYTLVAQVYYNSMKEKDPFVATVYNETIELVPALPDKGAQLLLLQMAVGGTAGVLFLIFIARTLFGGASGSAGKASKKASGSEKVDKAAGNEWLSGTLAHTEGREQKKAKKKA